jgi:PAS domain S-box-containing protein
MSTPLNVLVVEDWEDDAIFLLRELRRGGFEPYFERVETAPAMKAALDKRNWDIVIADHQLPQFSAPAALELSKKMKDDLPFIILSGSIGDDVAVEAMKAGAHDYIMKDNISKLVPAIDRALQEVKERRERKRAEEALHESEEKFSTLFQNAHDMIFLFEIDENGAPGRFVEVNEVTCKKLGYNREELMQMTPINLELEEQHGGFWKEKKLFTRGHFSYETNYVTRDARIIPVEVSSHFVTLKHLKMVLSICRDITERKQAENELKESLVKIQGAMEGIILVTAKTVEMRDPYTAGHQRSVSKLACAIAQEMELSEADIYGVRLASEIHDLGKIYVPAEILSKPGKISEIEMEMIRTHPRVGFDILKMIDFPWPIAKFVAQHHERLNGSGYPHGLKGDEIILGARILAVADVVDAMASHRPYRPALGVERSLDEISKNSAVLYDAKVVDACLRIFKEGSIDLEKELS